MNRSVSTARRLAAVVPLVLLGAAALPASATYVEGEWCEGKEVTKTVTEKHRRR